MNFKMIAAAAALVAAGTANASLQSMATGNGSVGFLAYNTTAKTSVFVDLGVNLLSFVPASYTTIEGAGTFAPGALAADGVTAVWNFSTGVYTLNGVAQNIGSTNWSAYGSFLSTVSTQNWAVIGGDITGTDNTDGYQHFVTTGAPKASQLTQQGSSITANMGVVDGMYTRLNTLSGMNSADNGSHFAANSGDFGYLPNGSNFGTNWANNLKWASTTTASTNSFWFLIGEGSEAQIAGTWTLDAANQTLTWQTPAAAVPEASTYAMLLSGLATIGLLRRRKAK